MMKNPMSPRYRAWTAGAGASIPALAAIARWRTAMKNIAKPLNTSADLSLPPSVLSIGTYHVADDI